MKGKSLVVQIGGRGLQENEEECHAVIMCDKIGQGVVGA